MQGKRGRPRRSKSGLENARKSVAAALKDRVRRIEEAHPRLGQYLRASLDYGTYITYGRLSRSTGRLNCLPSPGKLIARCAIGSSALLAGRARNPACSWLPIGAVPNPQRSLPGPPLGGLSHFGQGGMGRHRGEGRSAARNPDASPGAIVVSFDWQTGPRTGEWERLWRRILSDVLTAAGAVPSLRPGPPSRSDPWPGSSHQLHCTAALRPLRTVDAALAMRGEGLPRSRSSSVQAPALPAWEQYQSVAATEADLRRWLSGRRRTWARDCGRVSGGLVVLVFNSFPIYQMCFGRGHQPPHLGGRVAARAARVRPNHGPLPTTHYYDHPRCPSALEARSNGAYVVAPPSIHPAGSQYVWRGTRPDHILVVGTSMPGSETTWIAPRATGTRLLRRATGVAVAATPGSASECCCARTPATSH